LYCDTRFIGSLLMGKIFLENKVATQELITKCALEEKAPWNDIPQIKEEHWLQWEDALYLTSAFNDCVEQFSGALYATISDILPVIMELRLSLQSLQTSVTGVARASPSVYRFKSKKGNELLQELILQFNHYFDKDAESPIILCACVLDPRYRDWSAKATASVVRLESETTVQYEDRMAKKQQVHSFCFIVLVVNILFY
jgi:hypothetical protein